MNRFFIFFLCQFNQLLLLKQQAGDLPIGEHVHARLLAATSDITGKLMDQDGWKRRKHCSHCQLYRELWAFQLAKHTTMSPLAGFTLNDCRPDTNLPLISKRKTIDLEPDWQLPTRTGAQQQRHLFVSRWHKPDCAVSSEGRNSSDLQSSDQQLQLCIVFWAADSSAI